MSITTAGAAKDLNENLPNIKIISEKLRNGEHICRHHHGLFKEMRDNHDAYVSLFSSFLSQDLCYHYSGFYYIKEDDISNMSDRSKTFALAAICIIEHLGNMGVEITRLIDNATVIDDDTLDQVLKDQAPLLKIMNIHHHDEFHKNLNAMAKKGFLSLSNDALRPGIILYQPFHRYIDRLKSIPSEHQAANEQDDLLEDTL
jgi:hypothetical protein